MKTTEPITPPRAATAPKSGTHARRNAPPSVSDPPTFGEMLDEILPLVGFVAVAGPPVVLLVGPWLLFGLMLFPPSALLTTLVAVLVAATVLVALIAAILATTYLLVSHLRGRRAGHASSGGPVMQLAPIESPRAAP
jgi:hypothetical protein